MKFTLLAFLAFSLLLVFPLRLDAETPETAQSLLQGVGKNAKYNTAGDDTSLAQTVGNIISASLGILGVLFLAFTVFAGYQYLTAGGDEEQIKTAIKYLRNAIIGLIIVLSSFGITKWIVGAIVQSSLTQPASSTPGVKP
ncbi:MAG: hypothetical protein HY981_04470 [Candidatus Magasanikbacteria bacterium]|nr:hypothetical protein [Candidatus Magasanikbacteria bacterium]